MGLMLSVLVGCVGVLELLACLRHVTDGVVITINQPATPCLSYHDQNDNMSTHDSICTYSHTSDAKLPRSAKRKLENLHEYSLRIRTELKSVDKDFDYSALSECGARDFLLGSKLTLDSRATPDSRLSPDFNYLVETCESGDGQEDDCEQQLDRDTSFEDAAENLRTESSSRERPLSVLNPEPDKYVRVPTPVPFDLDDELSTSEASSDVGTSFDNDSGNEAPSRKTLELIPMIQRYNPSEGASDADESDYHEKRRLPKRPFRKSKSKSPDPARFQNTVATECSRGTENVRDAEIINDTEEPGARKLETEVIRPPSQKKRSTKSSSTIVRKSNRLKSKTSEVSKSAENLNARKSKRFRDPERRKSDISVQTLSNLLRDESTNTSPLGSPALSRAESTRSVQVQTSFDEAVNVEPTEENGVLGLSESRRDLTSRDRSRRSFKNRRFGSSRDKAVDEDAFSVTNATASVAVPLKDTARLLKISSFEEAEVEDYERVRGILTDSDSRETNGKRRQGPKGSKSVSSFEEDEDYWDAEDVSGSGPIEYTIPDPDRNKAFWVIMQVCRRSSRLSPHSLPFH